ncbi:MAG: helix-turn-helix domain-containing protein [Marinibacterium sp.]|nr:helix-turn-helix domain-containing protein [Marinibacterium sp.]
MGTVADRCGDACAHALQRTLPGTRFYVPQKYTDKGPLAGLDRQYADALIAEFGGDIIYVPSLLSTRVRPEDRFEEVEALVDQGLTTSEIAARLGISQTYVFRIRKAAGAPKIANKVHPDQLPLFDLN